MFTKLFAYRVRKGDKKTLSLEKQTRQPGELSRNIEVSECPEVVLLRPGEAEYTAA